MTSTTPGLRELKKVLTGELGLFESRASPVEPAEGWLLRAAFCRKWTWQTNMQRPLNIMWGYLRQHLHAPSPIRERYASGNTQWVLHKSEGHWLGLQKAHSNEFFSRLRRNCQMDGLCSCKRTWLRQRALPVSFCKHEVGGLRLWEKNAKVFYRKTVLM